MPKRVAGSDDSEFQDETKEAQASSPKKSRTPQTPRTRRISNSVSLEATVSEASTLKKRRREGDSVEPGSSPSKAALEAETILAQYSPGTKRTVKKSDLRKLQSTHEIRKEEALLRVEKQKELVEIRRQEIFSRLAELGYTKTLIERDGFDQLKARARWWQLVEEPQELTEQEWEKIRHDLCVILDRRKDSVRAMRAKSGVAGSASSTPLRPKTSPVRPFKQGVLGESNGDGDGTMLTGKRGLLNELDERPGGSEDSSEAIPKLDLGNTKTT